MGILRTDLRFRRAESWRLEWKELLKRSSNGGIKSA